MRVSPAGTPVPVMEAPPNRSPLSPASERALRLIIGYKTAKGLVEILGGVVLLVAISLGATRHVEEWAQLLRAHLTARWSLRLVAAMLAAATPVHFLVGALALLADGAFSFLEAFALHTRKIWGEWLVVVATASLVPFEVVEVLRHPHLGRLAVLILNLLIVLFLLERLRRQRKERGAAG